MVSGLLSFEVELFTLICRDDLSSVVVLVVNLHNQKRIEF